MKQKCSTPGCNNYARPRGRDCEKCKSRKVRERDPAKYYWRALKNNAKRRGKGFEITLEEFRDFCRKTKYIELKGRGAPDMTIDRIRSDGMYRIDNIQILTKSENSKKGNRDYSGFKYIPDSKNCPF